LIDIVSTIGPLSSFVRVRHCLWLCSSASLCLCVRRH